jgi:hypothetical protein
MQTIAEGLEVFQEVSERLLRDLQAYLEPYRAVLGDARFAEGLNELVAGMLGARCPHMTKAASSAPGQVKAPFSLAKRFYRLMSSENYRHGDWLKALQADARAVVEQAAPGPVIVALDIVNFEQPYAEYVEGISTVHKATPPGPDGKARLTSGFPTVLCEIVNLSQPAIPYAHFFSYTTPDFLSQNLEVQRAIAQTCAVASGFPVCFVTDSEWDDQAMFAYFAAQPETAFIIRAKYNRRLQVYNERLDRWEDDYLWDLRDSMAGQVCRKTFFHHAGQTRVGRSTLDWIQARFAPDAPTYWAVIIDTDLFDTPLVLWTNRAVTEAELALAVYADWQRRPTIEHLHRFIQEDGLLVEDMQLEPLESKRRLFLLILAAALFVLRLPDLWEPSVITWVRQLASAIVGTVMDREGFYLLLYGITAVLTTLATLHAAAVRRPFPRYG